MKNYRNGMKATSVSKKQIGCIYGAAKRGEIKVENWYMSHLYDVADYYGYDDNGSVEFEETKIMNMIDTFFAGDMKKLQKMIDKETTNEFELLSRKSQDAADRSFVDGSEKKETEEPETEKAEAETVEDKEETAEETKEEEKMIEITNTIYESAAEVGKDRLYVEYEEDGVEKVGYYYYESKEDIKRELTDEEIIAGLEDGVTIYYADSDGTRFDSLEEAIEHEEDFIGWICEADRKRYLNPKDDDHIFGVSHNENGDIVTDWGLNCYIEDHCKPAYGIVTEEITNEETGRHDRNEIAKHDFTGMKLEDIGLERCDWEAVYGAEAIEKVRAEEADWWLELEIFSKNGDKLDTDEGFISEYV